MQAFTSPIQGKIAPPLVKNFHVYTAFLSFQLSTMVSICGGGETSKVRRYDSDTDSWNVVSQMKNKRSHCLAATLPGDRIIVVGGRYSMGYSVEICE